MLQSVDLKSMDQVDHSGFNSNPFAPKSDLGTNQQISRNEILAKTLSFASYQPVLSPHTAEIGSTTVYKECLKNHAASLGGHALDGCGEFMPELTDPGLMKCAACGCHRNFHRQETAERRRDPPHSSSIIPSTVGITPPHFSLLPRRFASSPSTSPSLSPSPPRQLNPPPPPPSAAASLQQYSPGPHMLMALSTGKGASPLPSDQHNHHHRKKTTTESSPTRHIKISDHNQHQPHHHQTRRNQNPNPNNNNNKSASKRKRFRSKFSGEQKKKMRRFSEGLNWRIQRSDEKLVSDFCEDVGVSKTVLKVWMHNNKNTIGKIPRNSNNNSNHSSSNNNVEEDQAADQQLSHSASDHHQTNIDGGLGLIHHHLGNNGSSCSA